ncbi:MAG: alpha-mannosidase, partial [Acidobacteria bacterium]
MRIARSFLLIIAAIAVLTFGARGQEQAAQEKPVLYVVSNSHLDTQWNWTVQDSIRQFVPATFYDNFKLFERFPNYVFNFEGAIHYMWFKEYHPDAWATLQKYVDSDRWRLAGSWVNAVDTNVPSPESLMRQALYGKRFYRQEFGKVSHDIYLPDCFGFGFALPSIGTHCGLKAFSTQKLSWGAALPTPFAVGLWKGVDGSSLVASIRGGDYTARLRTDISTDPKWNADLVDAGGRKVGFRYFGVGDVGGAPDAESVGWLEKAMANDRAPVVVRNASADQLARDMTEAGKATLPVYEGELLLKTHGVGCYTSQAALKAWNRRNELLADAAERASVAAEWVGGPAYPRERLRTAWIRFLWHQFHDDLTGTSIPQAYQFSWNDQLLSLNQFSSVLTGAVRAVASGLDTRPEQRAARQREGVPIVVFNPIAQSRTDPVEASVRFPSPAPAAVRLVDMDTGEAVPAQVLSRSAGEVKVLFLATVPAVGFKVFDAQPSAATPARGAGLSVTAASLSNERYTVKLDAAGDIASVFDKQLRLELLKGPARLLMFDNYSPSWPAWEILWNSVSGAPRARARGPAKVTILERGPVRVALRVARTAGGSTFVQTIRLSRGGDRVDVETDVDWRTPGTLLKASFPLTASNRKATYDLGLGTIERENANENLYEVPAQQWADVTDTAGRHGVAILNDSKYGWDKPADNELRLTLLHTPTPRTSFVYQSSNDLGRHRFTYALAGHGGDWREGEVPSRAARLNQPPLAFQTDPHPGPFGRQLGLIQIDAAGGQVAVRAIKKAEDSDELVVRVQETHGKPAAAVGLGCAAPVLEAREITGAEEPVGAARIESGRLVFDLKPYQPR